MAPVCVSAVGVTRQMIDDPLLKDLIARLSSFAAGLESNGSNWSVVNVPDLVWELSKHREWTFQEQADLYEWIDALNAIDAALWQMLESYPGLILIDGKESGISAKRSSFFPSPAPNAARNINDVLAVPVSAVEAVTTILTFLSQLLKNATNKVVFNSVEQIALLLSAADDHAAALAIETLQYLATPAMLHRQQMPDLQQHTTALHTSNSATQENLMILARGWGSRGSGLGLHTCVTYDDAQQATLPQHAGEVYFEFLAKHNNEQESSRLLTIHLSSDEMLQPRADGVVRPQLKGSTAQMFFDCFDKVGGKEHVPAEKLVALLASIRLARAYHTQATRTAAVERRLRALIAATHSYSVTEVLSGYFQAQPESCSEIADLIRPTISSSSSRVHSTGSVLEYTSSHAALSIPHSIRILAMETLTAFVSRRDGPTGGGGLSTIVKHVNVLGELGVGKGQYVGLLPTLIRYCVASLNAIATKDRGRLKDDEAYSEQASLTASTDMPVDEDELAIGMAFLEATRPEPISKVLAEEQALEFIDAVLTLTSAVVSLPSGTAALTDCGLITALISVVALETNSAAVQVGPESDAVCLRKFITAQAVQLLEGAVVTHTSALTAFLEMNGVHLLVNLLHLEVDGAIREGDELEKSHDVNMTSENGMPSGIEQAVAKRPLRSTRRVIIYSIMNCLTVAFHHQQSNSTRSAASYLRGDDMTKALIDIMDNVSCYGGLLASLASTLLWDVMNADPQVVHHAHNAGLAASFLSMIIGPKGQNSQGEDTWDPKLPASPELIMALPNVLAALALTEDGARAVKEVNPFPSFFSILCSPHYTMPQSRCLLNDMTSIVGTGLDELMRHVPSLKPLVIEALVATVQRIVSVGKAVVAAEDRGDGDNLDLPNKRDTEGTPLEDSRTCFIQYSFNMCQLLEQIMQSGEHVTPFADSGGFEALLQLYPLLLPCRGRFLTQISCLSNPFTSCLTHYGAANSLMQTIKSVATHYDPQKLTRLMNIVDSALNEQLDVLEEAHLSLRKVLNSTQSNTLGSLAVEDVKLDLRGVLRNVSAQPIHMFQDSPAHVETLNSLSSFLRNFAVAEWFVSVLASFFRVANQRSQDMSHIWSGNDREPGWKAEICSPSFARTLRRITSLTITSQIEACRVRNMDGFEERDRARHKPPGGGNTCFPAKYRLRVVCQDGAVVRDGIEIDSCASVGNLEMGEIVEAYDRCINSSGVMRYCTSRGWISEHTRGHSKEPIAEVLSVQGVAQGSSRNGMLGSSVGKNNIVECGLPDLRSVSASILSRFQGCRKSLLSSLSRTVAQSVRSLPLPQRFTSQIGSFAGTAVGLIVRDLNTSFDVGFEQISAEAADCKQTPLLSSAGLAMYFGALVELVHSCLVEEKRERRILNIPLLLSLLCSRGFSEGFECGETSGMDSVKGLPSNGFLGAIRFVLQHSLHDMAQNAAKDRSSQLAKASAVPSESPEESKSMTSPSSRVSRSVCASLPPTLAIVTRLTTRSLFMNSHMWYVLTRMRKADIIELLGHVPEEYKSWQPSQSDDSDSSGLNAGRICRGFHCALAEIVTEMLTDRRMTCVPAHVVHPFLGVVGDFLTCLEEGSKATVVAEERLAGARTVARASRLASDVQNRFSREGLPNLPAAMNFLLSEAGRSLAGTRALLSEPFEPSEEIVERLVEMGFGRDHALEAIESTESNRLEIAMAYALTHPPPSPSTIERRRAAREERRRAQDARLDLEAQSRTEASSNEASNVADRVAALLSTGAAASTGSTEAMDCDESSDKHSDELSGAEKEALRKKELESQSIMRVEECLKLLRSTVTRANIDIIEGGSMGVCVKREGQFSCLQLLTPLPDDVFERLGRLDDGRGTGDVEAEALTTVVCTFLLDLCTRYPADRSKIVEMLLERLISHTCSDSAGGVLPGHESDFGSLCHAAVILVRALPRVRPLVLQYGFLNIVLHCIRLELPSSRRRGKRKADTTEAYEVGTKTWPRWFAPALLLLDVMAQPTAAEITDDVTEECNEQNSLKVGCGPKGEFTRMRQERKMQEASLSQAARDIFAAVNGKSPTVTPRSRRRSKGKSEDRGANQNTASATLPSQDGNPALDSKPSAVPNISTTAFPTIPCYVPLVPMEEAEVCMTTCLKVLRQMPKGDQTGSSLPSNIVHATLLLLARVVRSHKLASQCLMMGGAELLLSLPAQCRFPGNTGLVTVILRHLLEDEATLRCSMEAEIRSSITRLQKQQGRTATAAASERPKVKARSFVQAVTPLICRDTICFLKAAATSVMIEVPESNLSSGDRKFDRDNSVIVLLSSSERNRNLKAINEFFGTPSFYESVSGDNTGKGVGRSKSREKSQGSLQEPHTSKSRSPRHRSHQLPAQGVAAKKSKKDKHGKDVVLDGSPSNHVINLLLTELIRSVECDKKIEGKISLEESRGFLRVVDYLDLLADLVLAVPACAAAIHRYRPPPGNAIVRKALNDLHHSLSGCSPPPSTAVSYVLHNILPQPRPTEVASNGEDDEQATSEKKKSYMRVKLAQASARLLVALCARPGEGRRRVVVDLVCALGGGRCKGASESFQSVGSDAEMWALQSWAELCIGLAAPKCSGTSSDSNATLSWEVTKLMLQYGVPNSLMLAVQRVNLNNLLASKVAGALLRPIEVFSRGSVIDTVTDMMKKEIAERDDEKKTGESTEGDQMVGKDGKPVRKKSTGSRRANFEPSPGSEAAFADDAMLEDGFDPYTADRARQHAQRRDLRQMVENMGSHDEYDEDDDDLEVDSQDDDEDDNEIFGSEHDSLVDLMEGEEDSDEGSEGETDSEGEDIENSSGGEPSDSEDDVSDEDSESESDHSGEELGETEDDEEDVSERESAASEEENDGADSEHSTVWGGDEDQDFFEGSVRGDEADEAGVSADAELEEGWTRIDSVGFPGFPGGVLMRQARGLSDTARQRGFVVDASEAVIGNILRNSDIRAEALEGLEETLGIRISQRGELEGVRGAGGRFGLIGVSSTSSGSLDGEAPVASAASGNLNLSYSNRGSIGVFPTVRQTAATDIGQSSFVSGRTSELSAVDAAFSDFALPTARNDRESRQNDDGQDGLIIPANFDTQLFPGGPAAATHSRTQPQVHSLLHDVDLPQPNARTFQPSRHRSSRIRGSGPGINSASFFGGLFSGAGTSQVLRINRDGTPFLEQTSRTANGNLEAESRWTDDGLPLDSTTADFSLAFEQALATTMVRHLETAAELVPGLRAPAESGANAVDESAPTEMATAVGGSSSVLSEPAGEAGVRPDHPAADNSDCTDGSLLTEPMDIDQSTVSRPGQDGLIRSGSASLMQETGSISNEGEGVAQSLASGLNLSPQSDSGNISMEDTAAVASNSMTASGQTAQEQMFVQDRPVETAEEQATEAEAETNENPAFGASSGDCQDISNSAEALNLDPNEHGLVCPPGMDEEVFNSLPVDMQQEVVEQHRAALEVAAQLDSSSGLDPEALAALPEDMRREVILQDQQERERLQRQSADPSNAEEMDNASFIASLAPDLREEILLTADETFLSSLQPDIVAEAQILRERVSSRYREQASSAGESAQANGNRSSNVVGGTSSLAGSSAGSRRRYERHRTGRIRADNDRSFSLNLLPGVKEDSEPFITDCSMKALIRLMYLLSPVRPHRLLQKVFQNLCYDRDLRRILLTTFVCLLQGDSTGATASVDKLRSKSLQNDLVDRNDFPPSRLIGTAADLDPATLSLMFRHKPGSTAAAIAANLPAAVRGSSNDLLPPVVARRFIDTLLFLSKNVIRVPIEILALSSEGENAEMIEMDGLSCLDRLLDLIGTPLYSTSSTNLEQLLNLIECVLAALSNLPKVGEAVAELSKKEVDAAAAVGKEWIDIPRPIIAQHRLRALCSVLRFESCKDGCFQKVNTIARRVSRVEENRTKILFELASVAQGLAVDAIRDLKTLCIQLNDAAKLHQDGKFEGPETASLHADANVKSTKLSSIPASAVTLSSSSSELKLLRVLQTLHSLCGDPSDDKKLDGQVRVTPELVRLLHSVELEALWVELSACLRIVSVLEGLVHTDEDNEDGEAKDEIEEEEPEADGSKGKKLQSSVAGLLTRLLPTIEAYFMVNSSYTGDCVSLKDKTADVHQGSSSSQPVVQSVARSQNSKADKSTTECGGKSLVPFVAANKVLLNALLRANPSLLDKGLRAMVEVPQCRSFMDFDVKRHWFKSQVRRLRQHANRRHGSLRLNIRRKHVFEDAFHQLRLRNADEMRGRLHITFRNEEGVDAGGLTREFFAILAKEMFNPNYALFTSTEDGCTFQPNPNSSINPDHLSYFRFVGRIVGKAVLDGFLLDAHFTRSLYKHMLGVKPTHHDMQAIDPDYYKNLQMILQCNLEDIGLDLTFSTEDHSFGRSHTIDLTSNGRNIPVTEDTKEEYVKLVCQHRMTTSIQSQIKAYLDGFYELVKPELIAVFTAKELELLISGLPDIDMHDLQANTEYHNFKPSDPQIIWFWNIMFSLTKSQKAAFLQFVTGSSKVPLEGFSQLQGMRGTQKFSIHRAGGSSAALVSAHTCFNALDLPVYTSENEMREKILYAISEGAEGFLFA